MTVSDGIKVLEMVPKRHDISDERFHYHWGVLHPRVSRRVEPMKRYVQHHRIAPGLPGVPSLPVEGITEAWFESLEGANSGFEDPVFVAEGFPSMEKFMDLSARRWLFVTEEVVIGDADEGEPSARVVLHLRRQPGLTDDEFHTRLRRHAGVARAAPGLRRFAQYFPIPGTESHEHNFDAAEIFAWEDLEVLEETWAGDPVQQDMLGDLSTFCDLQHSGLLVAQAYRVKP